MIVESVSNTYMIGTQNRNATSLENNYGKIISRPEIKCRAFYYYYTTNSTKQRNGISLSPSTITTTLKTC